MEKQWNYGNNLLKEMWSHRGNSLPCSMVLSVVSGNKKKKIYFFTPTRVNPVLHLSQGSCHLTEHGRCCLTEQACVMCIKFQHGYYIVQVSAHTCGKGQS